MWLTIDVMNAGSVPDPPAARRKSARLTQKKSAERSGISISGSSPPHPEVSCAAVAAIGEEAPIAAIEAQCAKLGRAGDRQFLAGRTRKVPLLLPPLLPERQRDPLARVMLLMSG
jgi:hypothetical protein